MQLRGFDFNGLYAITDSILLPTEHLRDAVAWAIEGGARVIQYRDKSGDDVKRLHEARQLRELCHETRTCFIVNDDVELAHQVAADGVHIGLHDTSIAAARERLGANAIIGASCYNQLENAQAALDAGADYIAFGRFFPSRSKPNAVTADPLLLHWAARQLHCPVVAIGGITPDNGNALVEAGADMLAVIHGVFGQADIRAAAQRYTELFS